MPVEHPFWAILEVSAIFMSLFGPSESGNPDKRRPTSSFANSVAS
jgi:hypothetical protein